ncbi:MAG: peptidoglycan DD-metalloendopeptidase family protein [Bacteroidota bacterium]
MISAESQTKTEQLNRILAEIPVFPILGFELDESNTIGLDLSTANREMEQVDLTNTGDFAKFIDKIQHPYRVGIGGYFENRFMYKRSSVFDNSGEARSLHLGVDLWSPAETPVYAPIPGKVHSFAFNDRFGDYGATIILEHEIEGITFHSLYGHLSLDSLTGLNAGKEFGAGEELCRFGIPEENGHWPPHLHFQLIIDMQGKSGDYPGVAPRKDEEWYRLNCPDPNLILRTNLI